MLNPFAWTIVLLSLLSAAVWAYINYAGGRGRTLDYRLDLDPPEDPPEAPSKPPTQDPPQPSSETGSAGGWPTVAIVAPGRNEAAHLPDVLPRLCQQDYAAGRYRVVFVDDASTDASPAITAEMRERFAHLTVVRNDHDPPAGWMGKCWAVHRGVAALADAQAAPSSGHPSTPPTNGPEWLCFTDADILWDPRLLRSAVAYALEHDADLLGVTPTLLFGSAAEAVVQLQLVLALGAMLPFEKAMDPDTPWALTGGAFILVRKSHYDAIDGHHAVKGEMVEDLKLGMALKAAGARHRVALAGDLQQCRMYDGWSDMWEGLTKNAYAGLNHRWWNAVGVFAAVWLLNILPPVYALLAAAWLMAAPGWMPAVTLIAAIAAVLWQARALNTTRKLMHLPARYAWTMVPGAAAYTAIIAASAWRYHRGGNLWAGRRYGPGDTDPQPAP